MTKRKLLRIEKEEFFTESELAKLLRCSRSGLQKKPLQRPRAALCQVGSQRLIS